MPCRNGFFNQKKKKAHEERLKEAFSSSPVPKTLLQEKCEAVFGIKAAKLHDENISTIFTLMRKVGFTNVYDITNAPSESGQALQLKVKGIDALRAFVLAKSVSEAKNLYLQHAVAYIEKNLHLIDNDFAPLSGQGKDVIETLYPLLHDGLKEKKSHRGDRISHLNTIGRLINAIPRIVTSKSMPDMPSHQEAFAAELQSVQKRQVALSDKMKQKVTDFITEIESTRNAQSEKLQTVKMASI